MKHKKSSQDNKEVLRCSWCKSHPLYIKYHDSVWGVPVYEDSLLFEFLTLEGAQAGLNWLTVLKKREEYQRAFFHFDVEKVAQIKASQVSHILKKYDIIRNKLKVLSTIKNAKAFLEVQKEFGSFSNYLWCFVEGVPLQNSWHSLKDIPSQTPLSNELSDDLKSKGFSFVGPTIIYAYMQAVGLVNDHVRDCFRYEEVKKMSS